MNRSVWMVPAVLVFAVALLISHPGQAIAHRLLSSLRIETPKRVSASFSASASSNPGRRIQDLVARMVTDAASVTEDEPDQAAADVTEATHLAEFAPRLPKARADTPRLFVIGARAVTMPVKLDQLRTILREAGEDVTAPGSVDGARITVRTPRGIRAEYGHCPVARDTTLTGQLQGPPPTTPENRDCVILTENPMASADVPSGLDVDQLVRIALEVSGMSPKEATAFHTTFDWRTALSLAVPRGMRTSEKVMVGDAPALLMTAGWRRGPAYVLVWSGNGMVYSLSGYGSPAEAVPLASSVG